MAGHAKLSAAGFALTQSWRALRTRSRAPLYNRRAAAHIAKSDLFDADWYERRISDVADWGINPVRHYIAYGAAEGRDPSPKFETSWYLPSYSDVRESGLNPLAHYLRKGAAEGRRIANSE
jgi:hypothetical protein